jgi:hypothetical protein
MPLKGSGRGVFEAIDRFDGGVTWIAYPDERMERASHALVADDSVWVIDPVDVDGLDEALADLGDVAGVVVLLDRHKRDADAIARRHEVPVYIPEWMDGVASDLDAPVERIHGQLAETGMELHKVIDNPFWQEALLWDAESKTLVVPEAVGTASYFRTGEERLGVHPMVRAFPPARLRRFHPERILVGHGAGIHERADDALQTALRGSRRRMPALYLKATRELIFG